MIHVELQQPLDAANGRIVLEVAFDLPPFEVLAIMGPSGAGKTSILRMIAGLMTPAEGRVEVGGETWFDAAKKINLPPWKRNTGFVFQEYALFPHLTLEENLLFSQRNSQDGHQIDALLELINLTELKDQKPGKLSGGQQQRGALARALACNPKLLLLDEPFAALDRDMRKTLQFDFKTLLNHYPTRTLLVSHDPVEVGRLADKVLVMEEGKVKQMGRPSEVLSNLQAKVAMGEVIEVSSDRGHATILTDFGLIQLPDPPEGIRKGVLLNLELSWTETGATFSFSNNS
ncbi:MAG: ATP-binding cassette domain-containing protein [Bacteroidota bacterium]